MKIIFWICIVFFLSSRILGQGITNGAWSAIPPSPEASALGKYGDIQVSLATGIPNISIPFFDINTNDFSLKLNLSYHASGIKVEEIAPSTGLGWSLNAGGVITRVIRG